MSCRCETKLYEPYAVTIDKVTVENDAGDLKTFRLAFDKEDDQKAFAHKCGQFAMISVPGTGESPIGIASSPLDAGYVEFTVKRYPHGAMTTALYRLETGAKMGLRGPYGNSFPLEDMEGKDIVIVGGGFAFTTLRATIRYMLHKDNRDRFKKITVVYGARTPGELLYKDELKDWSASNDIELIVTVDHADENWKGKEGLIPTILKEAAPSSENAVSLICGPPIMLKFTMGPLEELGFSPDRIITSLERRMSCGVGKCGKCNIGRTYVCKDGPVFSYEEIKEQQEHSF